MALEKHLERESALQFEESEFYKALKEKTIETPVKALAAIRELEEDINVRNMKGETYLHLIVQLYERDSDAPYLIPVVFQMANAGFEVNAVDRDNNTALHAAAKSTGSRKLIRVLIMVGCDPSFKNADKHTPSNLAKNIPDNLKILETMSPCLWEGVTRRNKEQVERALANWNKVSQSRDSETLFERAEKIGYEAVTSLLRAHKTNIDFIHYCFAGDREKMRPIMRQQVNVNATTATFIDVISGEYVTMPLLGECALLGLDSVVRKLLRKSADIFFLIDAEPVYLYIIQNILPQKKFYQMVENMASKIEFNKRPRDTKRVLDAVYAKQIPVEGLRTFATSGLDIFAIDDDGHFLRDRILIKNIDKTPKKIESEMTFVDDIIVDIATFGGLDILRDLTYRNYEHIDVVNKNGVSSRQALGKAVGEPKAESFFKEMTELLKRHRNLCRLIEIGHLAQFQNLLTSKVTMVTDKRGRTLFHRAVLLERRHILHLLIKVCPKQVKVNDKMGRSPLHYACLQTEAGDMVEALVKLGCKMDLQDENGQSPSDFKSLNDAKKKALLEAERALDPGLDVYLFYRYMEIKEAIRSGKLRRVEEIRANMYQDISLEEISKRMYQTDTPQIDLLQMAVDAKRDNIAKFLLTSGMPWDVKYKDGKDEISLLEAAKRKELKSVENYINFQKQQKEEQAAMISRLKNKGYVKKK